MKLSTISGVVVLVTGLIAIGLTSTTEESTATQIPIRETGVQTVIATPAVEGVSPEVQRVLESFDKLDTLDPADALGIAPEIAKVLSYYEATLTVPLDPSPDA